MSWHQREIERYENHLKEKYNEENTNCDCYVINNVPNNCEVHRTVANIYNRNRETGNSLSIPDTGEDILDGLHGI